MSDPKEQRDRSDELDLEAESVKDLDVSEGDLDQVRGGQSYAASNPAPTKQQ